MLKGTVGAGLSLEGGGAPAEFADGPLPFLKKVLFFRDVCALFPKADFLVIMTGFLSLSG